MNLRTIKNNITGRTISCILVIAAIILFSGCIEDSVNNVSLSPTSTATEIDPQDADAWIGKGRDLHNLGSYEEAIEAYNEAIKIDPQFAFAWNNKGLALSSLGRYEEAEQCFQRAIEFD